MRGKIYETEWKYPADYDGVVKTFYRFPDCGADGKPINPDDGWLPFHEVHVKITCDEMASLSKEALKNLQSSRAAEGRRVLEEILAREES